MPGLERAMEPRPEVRRREGGGPQGKERQLRAGGPEGAMGATRRGGRSYAVTVPMNTPEGERFVLVPTATPDGQRIEPEDAVAAVRSGELEPLGVFASMQEAERAKSELGGGGQSRLDMSPQGLDEATVRSKPKGMPPGM